jgi:hypothetical protein
MSTTATDLKNVLNASETATQLEYVMQLGIDALNIFGCGITNLTGAAGSMTTTLTSKQRGGVFMVSRVIYNSIFKNAANNPSYGAGSLSMSTADLMSNSTVWTMIKDIAEQLKTTGTSAFRLRFAVGNNEPT